MSAMVKHDRRTLADRLAARLSGQDAPAGPPKGTLLLDISGSMAEFADPGLSKIDALRKVVNLLNPQRIFTFSAECFERRDKKIPDPQTDTLYGRAFETVKSAGVREVVLVTDGYPNDPEFALEQVRGLKLEIIYVGPQPRPPFLDRLAAACGGSVSTASLKAGDRLLLVQKIRGLLGAGEQ